MASPRPGTKRRKHDAQITPSARRFLRSFCWRRRDKTTSLHLKEQKQLMLASVML